MIEFFRHFMSEIELPLKNPVLIFSLILFIILLSPLLLKKINIPGIIGLIIAGVVIGPHGLNILAKNSAIDLFSTIGLLYIMFIAGLELDLNDPTVIKVFYLAFSPSSSLWLLASRYVFIYSNIILTPVFLQQVCLQRIHLLPIL